MWIKREVFEANLRRTAKLESEVESKQGQIARLQQEIDYWRGKFESALNRADRLVDKSLSVSGIGPISDLGVQEVTENSKIYEKMMKNAEKMNTEMFADEIPGEEEGVGVDPALVKAMIDGSRE